MSYSRLALGAVAAGCQPRGPNNAFKLINGIAKPTNCDALDAFQTLQAQINRFGRGAVKVDGDIGPATALLYNKIMQTSLSVSQIATGAPQGALILQGLATTAGLAAAKPIPSPRAQRKADGTVAAVDVAPPPPGSMFSSVIDVVASPLGIVAGVGAIGLLLFLGKKKRTAAPAAAAVPAIPKVV